MLSRRHLRNRVLMALYSWHQCKDHDASWYEKELFKGTERSYDLYLYLLTLLQELAAEEDRYYADLPPKHIQGETTQFSTIAGNIVIAWLQNDDTFRSAVKERMISREVRGLFWQVFRFP